MNLNLYTMEIRQHFPSFLIWCLPLAGLTILGCSFYPILTQNDFISQVDVLFKNPMMKNLMSAFNVNIDQLSRLASFYTTYTSIYVILIGCIFSISLSSQVIAREEYLKTADFLFTRPLSRVEIFTGKFLAYFTLLVALNLVTLFTGILGMELFKTPGSLVTFVTARTKAEMAAAFRAQPEKFISTFGLTSQDYLKHSLDQVAAGVRANPGKSGEYNIPPALFESLLAEVGTDPDAFLEKVKDTPDKYSALLKLPGVSAADFIEGIARTEAELADFKTLLKAEPARYVELFAADPGKFLDRFRADQAGFKTLLADFRLDPALGRRIFIYYPLGNYLVHCLYIFLLMLCLGSLGLALSVFVKGSRPVTGASIGITLGFYFINSISNLSPAVNSIGYFSPFKFVNNDILNPAYGLELWRVGYFAGITIVLLAAALLVFRRKDVLV